MLPRLGSSATSSRNISPSSVKTARGHTGFQVSSSGARHAIAVHSSSGEFLASFAITNGFMRATAADGTQTVLPAKLPIHRGWYRQLNGTKFKLHRLKSGDPALLRIDSSGKKSLVHFHAGTLYVHDGSSRTVEKFPMPVIPPGKTPGETIDEAGIVDNHGIWIGDDDFPAKAAGLPKFAGLQASVRPPSANQRHASYNQVIGGGGGGGGGAGYYVYYLTMPDAILQDFYQISYYFKKDPSHDLHCKSDYDACIACSVALGAAIGALLVCLPLGVICTGLVIAVYAAAYALRAANEQYIADGCGTPP